MDRATLVDLLRRVLVTHAPSGKEGEMADLALAEKPDLRLYEADGNHQSSLGAFLTACILCESLLPIINTEALPLKPT